MLAIRRSSSSVGAHNAHFLAHHPVSHDIHRGNNDHWSGDW